MHIDDALSEYLTSPELALVRSLFAHHHDDPLRYDSAIWHTEFLEYEPVTPGILICYLRNEEICNEWPTTLLVHCRYFLEEQTSNLQELARSCFYFWESRRRSKVNWISEGF